MRELAPAADAGRQSAAAAIQAVADGDSGVMRDGVAADRCRRVGMRRWKRMQVMEAKRSRARAHQMPTLTQSPEMGAGKCERARRAGRTLCKGNGGICEVCERRGSSRSRANARRRAQ